MDQGRLTILEKDFVEEEFSKNPLFSALEKPFIFAIAFAVQTKHGTNKVLDKNCAKEHGLLAKWVRS